MKDAAGQPVPDAELAVVVVDEAILALTNYQLADPLSVFYADRPARSGERLQPRQHRPGRPAGAGPEGAAARLAPTDGVNGTGGRSARQLPAGCRCQPWPPMAGAAAAGPARPDQPIRVRSDFNPLAAFAPAVRTDANGQAQCAGQAAR